MLRICEIQVAQHMISMKNKDFLVAQEKKLGARGGHWGLQEHSLEFALVDLGICYPAWILELIYA